MRKDSKKPASLATASSFSLGNHDHGVDRIEQLLHAALGLLHAALAFKHERAGHDGNRQRAHFAGERGDDGRGAGAGTAAEPGG